MESAEVALLDPAGVIVSVNAAWTQFCIDNGGDPERTGVGVSYLEACAVTDDAATQVRAAIESALAGQLSAPITIEIACDRPDEPRWFDVLISSRFQPADGRCIGASVTLSQTVASRRPVGGGGGARPAAVAFPDVTRLEMERLVDELTSHVRTVLRAQGRLRTLAGASAVLAAESGLAAVLRRSAELARDVVPARQVSLERFTPDGFTPERDQSTSHQAGGLEIAIRVRGKIFAHLHLSDCTDGQFTSEDEQSGVALAAIVAIAIDNALLAAEIERRRHWQAVTLEASRAIATAIDSTDPGVLDALVTRFAALGARADDGAIDRPIDPAPIRTEDESGSSMVVPFTNGTQTLTVHRRAGASGRPEPYEPADVEQLSAFADHIAIMLGLPRASRSIT